MWRLFFKREGLSPHIRGNRLWVDSIPTQSGSIPAHTGEPPRLLVISALIWVYPRTYGGTACQAARPSCVWGLSPHIRGNRLYSTSYVPTIGSIPAHTGEPRYNDENGGLKWVYPRTYGGTRGLSRNHGRGLGLSPHIRGNQSSTVTVSDSVRSIPAHTGEPSPGIMICCRRGVYPRTYGGTRERMDRDFGLEGLSPHIRGNPDCGRIDYNRKGSIPAHTGEPPHSANTVQSWRVYPRTYGGTLSASSEDLGKKGLSPHIRGNPGI